MGSIEEMLHFQLMQRTLLMILISIVGREGKQGLPQGSSDTSKKKPSLLQTSKKDLHFFVFSYISNSCCHLMALSQPPGWEENILGHQGVFCIS